MKKILSRHISLLLLCSFFLFPAISGQTPADTLKRIDAIFSKVNNNTPGAAIRISRGSKILYSKGFGMSDLEHDRKINDETIFEAGSVSKQFTATSILMLVRQGKISLDDDIRKYIPEFPEYSRPVKIRHLLNHTSGVRDWGAVAGIGGWARGTRVYTNKMALKYIIKQERFNNIPGDEYIYSNSNYTLLAIIVERVSGKILPEFTREFIFKPLGMTDTRWRNNFKAVVKNRAVGYDRINGNFFSNMPFENTYGHAALLTNVKDLDIWNKSWKNSPLGGKDLLALRTRKGILNNGKEIDYASGVRVGEFNHHPVVYHSGATAGYRCWLAYYPDDDLSVAYLSNATYLPAVQIGKEVAEIFFGPEARKARSRPKSEAPAYTPDIADLKSEEGIYYSPECDGKYRIWTEDGKLFLSDNIKDKIELKAVGKYRFVSGNKTYLFRIFGPDKQLYVTAPRARNVKFVSNN